MPRFDARSVDEAGDFTPIPEGTYPCECQSIETKSTKSGDVMWNIKWRVISGEYEGKIFYDNLVFSEAALSRVKLVAKRVALLDVDSGPVDFETRHLQDKCAMITVEINEYTNDQGKQVRNNKPTFGGYDYYQSGAPGDQKITQENVRVIGEPEKPAGGNVPF